MVVCDRERYAKKASVSEKDAGDRVEWKLKTRVTDPNYSGEKAKEKKTIRAANK